ncbi:MAG TPA: DUF2330 domain-containing protein, partial [Polyangiaceae bacterium]|nr:DUF2330 domain-containing protein [Polyangiaceae bacterium]
MHRSLLVLGISVATSLAFALERDAAACGGCFVPPKPPTQAASDITDERMLLSVSTQQSTLYDQIRYTGNPASFAWVLPIYGTVDVGLSADVLFDSMDVLTETQIVAPFPNCPPPPNCGVAFGASPSNATSGAGAGAAPPVVVTKAENVGPYATVQLHSTDSSALENWLAQNGFVIPADVMPLIAQYVTEGADFLAMKLLPGQGVQSMRPVRVTTPGAGLSLPLRMASIGTGAVVGITIWVVADGRYEPQNFPFFHIDDSELVWDYKTSSSNYTTLRVVNDAKFHNKGWEIESSLNLNQQLITSVILSGGQYFGGGRGFGGGIAAAPPADPSADYLPQGSADAGADGGKFLTAEEVRTADIKALFAGLSGPNVRVTRIRSDIAHTAMTADLVFQASADQSEVSNVRNVTKTVNLVCPTYPPCPPGFSGTNFGGSAGSSASSGAGGGNSGSIFGGLPGSGSSAPGATPAST